MKAKARARMTGVLMTLVIALTAAPSAFASDGEIGNMGDTNSIGNIVVAGNHVQVAIEYPHDCPPNVQCRIEVMFEYKCPEFYCGWGNQGWKALPAPVNGISTVSADCMNWPDEDNQWRLKYKVHWWANAAQTVELWGEMEAYIDIDGQLKYRMIAEAGFNVGARAGFRGGTKIQTNTAVDQFGPEVYIASTGGTVVRTLC